MTIEYLHLPFSFLASVLRLGAGASAPPVAADKPLVLYEFEGCPFCRIAREAVSDTGVTVLVRPCPKGGKRFRPAVKELGGKTQFPYLIDPNTNVSMYESADIARYLEKTYGKNRRPLIHWLGPFNHLSSQLGVLLRFIAGMFARRSSAPEKPLEFYGAERDPAARLVKEHLCELELEYLWRSRREATAAAPCLVDPNTGEERRGAAAIRRYLKTTYAK